MFWTLLTGLAFGLGVVLVLFGSIFCHKAFRGESMFNRPLIPMGVSFAFLSVGLTLLFLIFLSFL